MAYIAIQDFKFGLDRRRPRVAGVPGTLWTITNAHLTRGGDIERAKKFASNATLISDTFGMVGHRNLIHVFGSASPGTGTGIGPGANDGPGQGRVRYMQLAAASGADMTAVLDAKQFDGKLYVIAEYADGHIHHFYDKTRVSDWDTIADGAATVSTLTRHLAAKIDRDPAVSAVSYENEKISIVSAVPGTDFTIAVSATDGGATNDQTISATTGHANVAAVAATRATGTLTVSGDGYLTEVTVNSINLLRAPVEIAGADDADRVADSINDLTDVHGYSATAASTTVTISAPAVDGASANTRAITVAKTDDVTTSTTNFTGGADATEAEAKRVAVDIGGTFEPLDQFTVTINGTDYTATGRASATGTSILVHKSRVFSTADSLLRYSKLNDPSDWTDASASTGAGFLNLSSQSDGSQRAVAAVARFDQVAVFGEEEVFLYNIGADAANFAADYPVGNTGTVAPLSVVGYGNSDVFYLDRTGVRSLRARNSDGAAFVSDVGNAIDSHVTEYARSLTDGSVRAAKSLVDPIDGRLWVAIDERIYSFSYFPGSKISAWSTYEPGFDVDVAAVINGRAYVRSGDTIYLYGGESGDEYPDADEQTVTVEMPFMSAERPATIKMFTGFDAVVENTWDASLLVDPDDETLEVDIGQVYRTTGSRPHIAIPGRSAMAAVKMTCSAAGKATISSVALHFEQEEQR